MQMNKSAIISLDKVYRYQLTREWDSTLPTLNWIMLNPSTADAEVDDATIRRCVTFSRLYGHGGMKVYNLFALRSTDPTFLRSHADPVGPENDEWLRIIPLDQSIVAAWGSHGDYFPERVLKVLKFMEGRLIYVMGRTQSGQPKHPVRLANCTPLNTWESVPPILPATVENLFLTGDAK